MIIFGTGATNLAIGLSTARIIEAVLEIPLAVTELLGLQGSANTLNQVRDSLNL